MLKIIPSSSKYNLKKKFTFVKINFKASIHKKFKMNISSTQIEPVIIPRGSEYSIDIKLNIMPGPPWEKYGRREGRKQKTRTQSAIPFLSFQRELHAAIWKFPRSSFLTTCMPLQQRFGLQTFQYISKVAYLNIHVNR